MTALPAIFHIRPSPDSGPATRSKWSRASWSPDSADRSTAVLKNAPALPGYYLLLDRGYRSGDLSIVYPIARGSAPLITVLCAVLFLREHPSALAVAGAVLIGGGAVALTGDPRKLKQSGDLHAVGYALLT